MFSEILAVLFALIIALVLITPQAQARPLFSYVAIDASTGKVLDGENIDSLRYPASLTKMMTLYMLFERMEAGKLTKKSRLKVSRYASTRPPSKLGLKPGQTIAVEDAIKALVTKSANDVAATIGENIAGSERNFAKLMTAKARSIGMSKTTFRNASGLPNKSQKTTARDMATLGLRLQKDFPQYFKYFSLRTYKYKGRNYRNHNHLLRKVKGMDGIKTGYTRASGFNLVTSVGRGNQRIVAVVMGGRTSARRNAFMAKLIKRVYKRNKISKSTSLASRAGENRKVLANTNKKVRSTSNTGRVRPTRGKAAILPTQHLRKADISAKGTTFKTAQLVSANASIAKLEKDPASWQIQVGAFPDQSVAQLHINKAMNKAGHLMDGKTAFTQPASKNGKRIYRARFTGFDRTSANETCKLLKRNNLGCFALAPRS